jgi:hypothetical protein
MEIHYLKNKKYHTVRTVPKYNGKMVGGKIDISNTQIQMYMIG